MKPQNEGKKNWDEMVEMEAFFRAESEHGSIEPTSFVLGAQFAEDNAQHLPKVKALIKTMNWVAMNSGIAGDGNHVDIKQAHKDNVAKIDEALKALESE